MRPVFVLFSFVILLATLACETDAPVLQGDVHGMVSLVDSYGFGVSDISGISVHLTGENTLQETTTDSYGQYTFTDLPYGKYYISLIKEKYIPYYHNFSFNHIGGEAPTVISYKMSEIPEYSYGIDSMIYYRYNLDIYMHIIGATEAFNEYSNFYVHCFFSQSPDVSCDNYEHSFMWMATPDIYYTFWHGSNRFLSEYTGTVYCRIYPQADYYEKWEGADASPHAVYPETLGPPSEVFSFTVAGITRPDQY